MPAEFDEHECTVIVWPARASLWGHHLEQAKRDYAEVIKAVAAFEEVVVVANPGAAAEVLNYCGIGVTVTEIPVDDSWVRDSGPIVVSDGVGRRAVVQLGFDGWGQKYVPYDKDARLATALADVFGLPVFRAPIVSEGGAFLTDGEGTLFTTEGSVIHEVRNPGLTRERAEAVFRDYLGVDTVIETPMVMWTVSRMSLHLVCLPSTLARTPTAQSTRTASAISTYSRPCKMQPAVTSASKRSAHRASRRSTVRNTTSPT